MARFVVKKKKLEEAALNHIREYGPSTANTIAYQARCDNGKLLKNHSMASCNPQQAYSWLMANPKFTRLSDGTFDIVRRGGKDE